MGLPAKYDPPRNRGNTRVGHIKGSGGNNKAKPWRRDPIIRERMLMVHKLWAEGYSPAAMLVKVNEWAQVKIPSHPEFSMHVIRMDKERILSLIDEENADMRAEHLESLKHLKKRAYEEIDSPGMDNMAKPGFMNVIRAAEETGAKIDGSLIHRSESKIMMTSDVQARILVQVLVKHLGSEEVAFRVLDEVQGAIEAAAQSSEAS